MTFIRKLCHFREHLILFFSLWASTCMICLFLVKLTDVYSLSHEKTDALGSHVIRFLVTPDGIADFSFLTSFDEKDFSLITKQSDSLPLYHVLYSTQTWPLSNGRNFQPDDFTNLKRTALVGSQSSHIIELSPLTLSGHTYSIIGTRKDEKTFASRFGVFFSDGLLLQTPSNQQFIIDSSSDVQNKQIFDKVHIALSAQGYKTKIIDIQKTSVEDFFRMESRWFSFLSFFLVIYFTMNLSILLFWLMGHEDTARVYQLLGLSTLRRNIYFSFLKIFLAVFLTLLPVGLFFTSEKLLFLQVMTCGCAILLIFMQLALFVELEILIHHHWFRSNL